VLESKAARIAIGREVQCARAGEEAGAITLGGFELDLAGAGVIEAFADVSKDRVDDGLAIGPRRRSR
jgi:hypothetical protein